MVRIVSRIVRVEYREPVPLLNGLREMADDVLAICSFCKRIRIAEGHWVEVEEAMHLLGLIEAWPLPQLSHGVCEACFAVWEARFDEV